MIEHRQALCRLFQHYREMFLKAGVKPAELGDHSMENAAWLAWQGIYLHEVSPIDKLNRWLGFIQAVAIFNNLTTVQAERDYTRPLLTKVPIND
jgi:hypothetical protein